MILVRLAAEINDPGMVHQSMRGNAILAWLATSGAEIKDPGMVGHFKCEETWPWHGSNAEINDPGMVAWKRDPGRFCHVKC